MIEIRQLSAVEGRQYVGALADVLLDCVAGGASVSFMASLSKPEAEAFFEKVLEEVERGERILLAAFVDYELLGTVQILTATPPNQPHRAERKDRLAYGSSLEKGIRIDRIGLAAGANPTKEAM